LKLYPEFTLSAYSPKGIYAVKMPDMHMTVNGNMDSTGLQKTDGPKH